MTLRNYLEASRQPRYSVLFVLPLFLLYEGLALLMSRSAYAGVRNGADVLLKTIFVALGGPVGVTVFGLVLVGGGAWLVMADVRRRGRVNPRLFAWMTVESVVYAVMLGTIVSALTAALLRPTLVAQAGALQQFNLGTQLVVSLGAGLYEELVFRVLLVSGLTVGSLALGAKRWLAVSIGVVGSALIFSGFHYIGPLGDPFTLQSFTFRAIAGLLLSGLYVARGFGITAWSHALYDVMVAL